MNSYEVGDDHYDDEGTDGSGYQNGNMQPYMAPRTFEGFVSIIRISQHKFSENEGGSKF